ncbi:MAG: hypothetical protein JZU63_02075, partial [Rhodoferax sp.]|nr:hypothetical protein [Rhodoferax sp.]
MATTENAVIFSGTVNSQSGETNDLTITAGTGQITFTGAVGGSRGLGNIALTSTGNTTFTSTVDASSLVQNANSGSTLINGGRITTSSSQTYNNAVTLGADTALIASTTTFNHTLSADYALAITGDAVFGNGASDTVTLSGSGKNLSVSGATTINTDHITSSGTQTYTGAVSLGADTTLSGTTITFNGNISGAYALAIVGHAVIGDASSDSLV